MLRLRDDHWERIRNHFPEEHSPDNRPGRKPIPTRTVWEAVLWILNTGVQWHFLPQCYPNYKAVHRRFQQWCHQEVLHEVLTQLATRCATKEQSMNARASSMPRLRRPRAFGEAVGLTKRGKGVKVLAIVDRHGLPLSVSTHAATHHVVTLVQLRFDFYMLEAKPEHLIGDRADDSDGLDDDLKQDGVNLIAPHRSTRKLKTQDGRHLRRHERRWLVERFFAWLQWKRRRLIRWEYYVPNFLGFVQFACSTMRLKQF
ncbi:putative Transposase [Nitrospira defluvii]|jgi:transposase|uniref:Putative Transposase n=1 Tax=Nitrospira defluvii TaxID=330214 RepID=D8PE61_9BACT|nr:putative Transposase [Nitrospira defluvii]